MKITVTIEKVGDMTRIRTDEGVDALDILLAPRMEDLIPVVTSCIGRCLKKVFKAPAVPADLKNLLDEAEDYCLSTPSSSAALVGRLLAELRKKVGTE